MKRQTPMDWNQQACKDDPLTGWHDGRIVCGGMNAQRRTMKRVGIFWIVLVAACAAIAGGTNMSLLSGKRVVMIIASHDFRDEELAEPLALLTQAGATVTVASSRKTPATGMLGKKVIPDILAADVKATNYDAVVFVGGGGAQEYFADATAHRIAQDVVKSGKLLGAICIAPAILANAGVLKGRQAVCFPSVVPILKKGGATVPEQEVVRDGRIVTATGPHVARLFGQALVAALGE